MTMLRYSQYFTFETASYFWYELFYFARLGSTHADWPSLTILEYLTLLLFQLQLQIDGEPQSNRYEEFENNGGFVDIDDGVPVTLCAAGEIKL